MDLGHPLSSRSLLQQRAIFILAGMNFLYTISWKREEEGGRIGEGGRRRMRRAFSSLPARPLARPAIWTFWRHDAGVWNAAAALSQLEGWIGGNIPKIL